jgi:hypothetical protein
MLWEVLLDELNINSNNIKLISNIKTVFDSNINPFLLRANKTSAIMVLNKQFLGQVVLAVNRLFPTLKQDQVIKKITITNEEILEPYKIEDIHASRQSNFEKEVDKKKIELETYMIPNKPQNLDFSDNNTNNPLINKITEMGPLLAEKMAERNLELEQIQNTNYNSSTVNPEIWLKSLETSVKTDNKDIKINSKKVSFINEEETTKTIFQKLKKSQTISIDDPITLTIYENTNNISDKYIEQKSMPLPEQKSENNQRNIIPNTNSIIQNIPMIPNHEFIKQLNEMNTKIDSLYEIVNTLTNSIKSLSFSKDSTTNINANTEISVNLEN